MPSEVAVCLSFAGDLTGLPESEAAGPVGPVGDIHHRARNRGRIFLGGFSTDASGGVAPNIGRPLPGLRTDIANAATALRNNAGLAARGISWAIYSRVRDDPSPLRS